MSYRLIATIGLFALICALVISCSGDGRAVDSPVSPVPGVQGAERQVSPQGGSSSHQLWSYHLVFVDPNEPAARMVPLRLAAIHWNVLGFLEQGPCFECVEIAGLSISPDSTLLVDLKVRHPFPVLNLTGFDVRGIVMFEGSHAFPVSGLSAPDRDLGDGELVNADGHTTLYNSSTAGSGPGGLQGYLRGKFASAEPPDAQLNGFRRYISDDPANTRNAFYAGEEITVTFEIDPPDGPFIFGYAVDASWVPPTTKPVTDPMTDFPPEANCPEPWKIKVVDTPVGQGLTVLGGQTVLTIRVDDHQGKDTHSAPVVECPELFDGSLAATLKDEGPGYSRWEVTVENEKPAGEGFYKCLVSVEDQENDPVGKPWLDLTAYQIYLLEVQDGCVFNQPPLAAASTFPSPPVIFPGDAVAFSDASTDPDGPEDIVAWDWDFSYDPADGFQIESSIQNPWHVFTTEDEYQVQLRVTDSCGAKDALDTPITVTVAGSGWARTWGEADYETAYDVAVDSSGNAYVTGEFMDASDFDPGPDTDWHESSGYYDVFLSKFDSTGRFQWARTWGGTGYDRAWRAAVDNFGNPCVVGNFEETVDFDPGPGVDEHVCNGTVWAGDIFVSKFDSDGSFLWARSWGGERDDPGYGIAVDRQDNIYTAGSFWGTVDFDPGPGVDEHSPIMNDAVYLSKLDAAGSFLWARTWGGTYSDYGFGVATDSDDNAYVTGMYGLTVDFDPGPGTEERTSTDWWDVFLTKFDSAGDFQWVQTWGGSEWEQGSNVAVDGNDNVYVTGFFQAPVDFDPGPGLDIHDTAGSRDVFLSKFDSDGVYQWVATWGGTSSDESNDVAADENGQIYVAGWFSGTSDFDPGPGTSEIVSNGQEDAFVSVLSPGGLLVWARGWGGTYDDNGWGVADDDHGNVFAAGPFYSLDVDFDPGPGIDEHDAVGETDAFLVKFLPNGYWEW